MRLVPRRWRPWPPPQPPSSSVRGPAVVGRAMVSMAPKRVVVLGTHARARRAPASRLVSSHRWPSSSPSYCCPTSSPPPPPAKATPRRLSRLIGPVQRERAWVSCQTRRIDTRAGTVCGYCQAGEHTHLRCGSRLALRCLCACGSCAVRFRGVLGSLLPHLVLALLLLRVRRRLLLALRLLGLRLGFFTTHRDGRVPRVAKVNLFLHLT